MTTIELKELLIHRIAEINEVSFHNAMKTILDAKTPSQSNIITAEEIKTQSPHPHIPPASHTPANSK